MGKLLNIGSKVDWIKHNPIKASIIVATLGTVGIHRKRSNDNIGDDPGTMYVGAQSSPIGSSAGMNNHKSAYIQPAYAGYDNPSNQGKRHGFRKVTRIAPPLPTFSNNQPYQDQSRLTDYSYDPGDMNQDQQLSRMI